MSSSQAQPGSPIPTPFVHIDNPPYPTITTLPSPEKRHFFNCGDLTLSWEQEWYTAPFFLSSRASYDRAASTGAVNPPVEVYRTVGLCQRQLGITVESTITTTTNADGVAIWTTQTSVITTDSALITSPSPTRTETESTSTASSSTTSSSSSSSTSSASSSSSASSALQPVTSSPSPTARPNTSVSTSSAIPTLSSASALPASSTNACAGDWDFQAWGVVTNILFGLLVGALLWGTWAVLRGRIPGFFLPRTWFVPSESRPSRVRGVLAFLFPFAHMPSLTSPAPLSSAALAQRNMWTGLQLALTSSLIAFAAALPEFIAGVPCLAETSPRNEQGGRLGTMTDLSLLRLLNALDPSPDSNITTGFIQILLHPTSHARRALPSTIAPASPSARTRLIVLLVLTAVLIIALSLRPIARGYSKLTKYRKHFNETICGGMSMAFIASKDAKAWNGKTEEAVKTWLREKIDDGGEGNKELDVVGVFAVPDTRVLRDKVKLRAEVLDMLEVAEARYIQAGRSTPSPLTLVRPEPDFKSSKATGTDVPELIFSSPTSPTGPVSEESPDANPSQRPNTEETGTRFVEINRDSGVFGRRFKIGQRIKVDDQGQYVPDPSPDSSDEGHRFSQEGILSATTVSSREETIPEDSVLPSSHETPLSEVAPTPAGPSQTPVRSVPPAMHPPPTGRERHDPEVEAYRTQFKALNEEISILQQDTFASISRADPVHGWILVGRGVEYLAGAQIIEGRTREDILWANIGHARGEKRYHLEVIVIGFLFFLITVPFIGLTVATAPGYAHYLPFLEDLAASDGLWAGIVEALVPAFVLSHLLMAALLATYRLSKRVKCISATHQRALAYKASFWLLLFAAALLPITVAALQFATQGFVTDVQAARSVGDGAIYITWFVFVVLLNIAIIVPGLLLLQPLRLFRYLLARRSAITPRRRFRRRLPPAFIPSLAIAPTLIAVFYATSILVLFPLLAIPLLIMLYLSFIVVHHQVEYVYAPSTGFEAASLAIWTTRRLGWSLALQPFFFGLILLSRNEWAIGGASFGVSALTILLTELLTVGRQRNPSRKDLAHTTLSKLDAIARSISRAPSSTGSASRPMSQTSSQMLRPRQSTSSMLRRLTALLPGLSRLPHDCPIPLPTQTIDDLHSTERASYTRPDLKDETRTWPEDLSQRGLIYPPELTAEVPIIWLPRGKVGLSGIELNDLASNHGLEAIIDPPTRRSASGHSESGGRGEKDAEVRSPLIS